MAVKLSKGRPKARRIELDAGSETEPKRKPVALWVRPATFPEQAEATARIQPMIAALREGSDAALQIADMLGEEFAGAVFDDAKLAAAAEKLAMMLLVELCCERIEGTLLADDNQPVATVDAAVAGLLMCDALVARMLRAVIDGPLFEVVAEKNGSAASPSGEAATPGTAPAAGPAEPPAQKAAAE